MPTTLEQIPYGFEFGFQGQLLDIQSGLMNYGHRSYSPYLGRWMCKDPFAERGGMNVYSMVGNRPVNLVDRFGLADFIRDIFAQHYGAFAASTLYAQSRKFSHSLTSICDDLCGWRPFRY